jgi:HAD superfamily hydrolase (TIGR01450 family)
MMKATSGPLIDDHDLLLIDLDGVLYVGDQAVAGAADVLAGVRTRGVPLAFVTNNAARTPTAVAEQLRGMGVSATPDEVVTSAMAAAQLLADDLEPGAAVLVVGGEGVREALLDAGLRPVTAAADSPVAVVQGWAAEVGWSMLAEAMVAVRAGARWIATNRDVTLPSPRGPLPGNGSMVAALVTALGRDPEVVGKPEPALFRTARRLATGSRPLVIGDRLDTDIAGARAAALPGLLVLTGVSSPADLIHVEPASRPDYIGRDLGALELPQAAVDVDPSGDRASCGDWTLRRSAEGVTVEAQPDQVDHGDGLDGLRALCGLAWSAHPLDEAALDQTLQTLDLS